MEAPAGAPAPLERHNSGLPTETQPRLSQESLNIFVNGKLSLLGQTSEFLAKGSGGTVFSDECHECQERVAVKIIRKTANNKKAVESEKEISLLLNHPNVIKTYRAFEHDDNVYLVQELASGGDVCDYLAKHGAIQDERVAKGLFRQVAEGVRYLHKIVKVTHNDIKPDNIVEFVGGEIDIPRVCLIDFGHSQFIDPQMRRPGIFGTSEYMPPEVYNNRSRFVVHNGETADIWALGMTLFAMLTGTLPWANPSPATREFKYFLYRYKKGERGAVFIHNPVQMLGFTSHLVDLLDGMLDPDPKKRFTIDEVLPYLEYPWINLPTRRRSSALIAEQGKPVQHTKPEDKRHPNSEHVDRPRLNGSDDMGLLTTMLQQQSLSTCIHGAAGESFATGRPLSGLLEPPQESDAETFEAEAKETSKVN